MQSQIQSLIDTIKDLEARLEAEFSRRRAELNVGLENGRVVFEEAVKKRHRELRVSLWEFLKRGRFKVIIVAPVIYSLIIPFALLDLFVSIYQALCFPVYGISKVRRRDYLIFDRHHLAYLNGLQKINCAYCSYCTGLLAYVSEIAARTEAYWCPVKHARRLINNHSHYADFSDFGDAEGFQARLEQLRTELAER